MRVHRTVRDGCRSVEASGCIRKKVGGEKARERERMRERERERERERNTQEMRAYACEERDSKRQKGKERER